VEGDHHLESQDSSLEESKIADEHSPQQKDDYLKKLEVEIASLNVSLICKNSLGVRKEVALIHMERP
jgi:energy-converting hydrogenase Eha subunit E